MPLIDFWVKTCDSRPAELPLLSSSSMNFLWGVSREPALLFPGSSLGPRWQKQWPHLEQPHWFQDQTHRPTGGPPIYLWEAGAVRWGFMTRRDAHPPAPSYGQSWVTAPLQLSLASVQKQEGRKRKKKGKGQQKKTLGGSVGKHSWGSNSEAFNGS